MERNGSVENVSIGERVASERDSGGALRHEEWQRNAAADVGPLKAFEFSRSLETQSHRGSN